MTGSPGRWLCRGLNSPIVVLVLIVLSSGGLYALTTGHPFVMDEHPHFTLIRDLFNASSSWEGFWVFDYRQQLPSMLPGYHWIMAGTVRFLGLPLEIDVLRFVSLVLSLLAVVAMLWAARGIVPERAGIRVLQFSALPMCFPLLPLIYTDVVALFFVVLSAGFYFRQRLLLAGLMASIAILFRQTNIAWLVVLLLMSYVDQFGYRFQWQGLPRFFYAIRTFLLGGFLFLAFVIWNDGVPIGMHRNKQEIAWNTGNVFFFLQMFSLMFLPWLVIRWRDIAKSVLNPGIWVLIIILLVLYVLTGHPTHPWNVFAPNLLRNQIIGLIRHNEITFLLGFIPVAIAVVALRGWPILNAAAFCLLPGALLVLMPAPLIDLRYYLPVCMFLLLFTKPQPMRHEVALFLWLSLLAAFVATGHLQGWFAI